MQDLWDESDPYEEKPAAQEKTRSRMTPTASAFQPVWRDPGDMAADDG